MTDAPTEHRFYNDLAAWWPLISPPQEYAQEAAYLATVLDSASIPVREVLELGSGGGHNAAHLKARFAMTLVDLSEDMLNVSRQLNPSAIIIGATCARCGSPAPSTRYSSTTAWTT